MPNKKDLVYSVEIQNNIEKKYTIIWMHGLGGEAKDFLDFFSEQLSEFANTKILLPDAPIRPVSINNGLRMRSWYDIMKIDQKFQENIAEIQESKKAIEYLILKENERGIENNKIVLGGFSQGCALALYIGLRMKKKLAAIIGLSGYLPDSHKFLEKENWRVNHEVPIFLAHGKMDSVITLDFANRSFDSLRKNVVKLEWKTYDADHSIVPQEIIDIKNFLKRVLI